MRLKNIHPEIIYVEQEGLLEHLSDHPESINDKKFHELLVGWLLTQFLNKNNFNYNMIGFPALPGLSDEIKQNPPNIFRTSIICHSSLMCTSDSSIIVSA